MGERLARSVGSEPRRVSWGTAKLPSGSLFSFPSISESVWKLVAPLFRAYLVVLRRHSGNQSM